MFNDQSLSYCLPNFLSLSSIENRIAQSQPNLRIIMSDNNTSSREGEDVDHDNNNNENEGMVTFGEVRLYSAIVDGNSDDVDDILRKHSGSSVNVNRIFSPCRMTPLIVEYGADVKYIIPGNDFTVLHYALQDIDSDSLGVNIENSMQKINLIIITHTWCKC